MTSEPTFYKNHKNLWDLLSGAALNDKQVKNLHNDLQNCARYPMQEITLQSDIDHDSDGVYQPDSGKNAWIIHIHSADPNCANELKIRIPSSSDMPIIITETLEKRELVSNTVKLS